MNKVLTAVLGFAFVAAACGQASNPDDPNAFESPNRIDTTQPTAVGSAVEPVDGDTLAELVAGNTELALDLFGILAADGSNTLLGPASISEGLALPFLGARGATAIEMADVLNYTLQDAEFHAAMTALRTELGSRQNDQLEMAVANRVFGQEGFGFLDEYLADLSRWYEAPLGTVDFFGDPEAARDQINAWTADQTNDRIPELFPQGSVTSKVRLALVNAIYLKADWHFPFNPDGTEPAPFTLPDGSEVDVDMMSFNEFLPSGFGKAWAAVQLPYAGEAMSMIVVVPTNLGRFRANLTPEKLERIRSSINEGGIHLRMPKFELSYHSSLVEPLQELGLSLPFGDAADFSGMTGSAGLFIDAIEHETFVKVDEEGTEAAAATGTLMAVSHGPTVWVDKPFIFWIQDDATGAILFLGQVTDPRGDS